MSPLVRKFTDCAIVVGVSAAVSLLIIAIANSLVAKATIWKSYVLWLNFVTRPDIVATALLVVTVAMGVSAYQQNRGKR